MKYCILNFILSSTIKGDIQASDFGSVLTLSYNKCKNSNVPVSEKLYSLKSWQEIKFGGLPLQLPNWNPPILLTHTHVCICQCNPLPNHQVTLYMCKSANVVLQWRFWAQPPNLIPANISGYTVSTFPWLPSHKHYLGLLFNVPYSRKIWRIGGLFLQPPN